MFKHRSALHRRHAPQDPTRRVDRRSGAPVRPRPEPLPRIRWYS